MWTIEEALEFIKLIQRDLRAKNYHVVLGGGVLNNRQSDKDLDLYFLPLEDDSQHPDDIREFTAVMEIMHRYCKTFGQSLNPDYEHLRSTYQQKLMYDYNGKRIDCFIV